LVDYKAKGHTAELQGKDVNGKECYKIKLTLKAVRTLRIISYEDYYVVRMKTAVVWVARNGGIGGGGANKILTRSLLLIIPISAKHRMDMYFRMPPG
jgi:hypothetical protein